MEVKFVNWVGFFWGSELVFGLLKKKKKEILGKYKCGMFCLYFLFWVVFF